MRPALRRVKKVLVKTPGARYVWHRVKRKSFDRCGICGKKLQGSRRDRPYGDLCVSCSRTVMRKKVI